MSEYKRLTKKTIGCFNYDIKDYKHKVGEFSDYDAFFAYNTAVKRLGELEDKIERGEIVDIKAERHRMKVLERALDKATELAYEYRTEQDTLSCSSCPMFDYGIFDSCKERGLYEECSKLWKDQLMHQAEKELQEKQK